MQFAHSIWLIMGLAACTVLGWGFYHFQKRSQAALQKFAAGHLLGKLTESVSPGRRMTKRVLIVIAVASIFVALARPQVGFQWKEVKRKGIDILMAVDTSKSMLANDVKPNRLERSKLGIMDFVSKLDGDRVGLIPFAGTAFLMCPLTLDYDAFRQSLNALDTQIIPQGGTDIASAIREAAGAFSNDANHKILVLVTDGEDLEGEALNAAKEAAQKGMTLYAVGVGTPAGELIPLKKSGKGSLFVKDAQGQVVKSRLDEKMLQKITQATGGQYEPLGRQAEGLDAIYKQKLSLVPKQELAERMQRVPIERFEWPLLLAFVLLVVEFAISDRKPHRKKVPVIRTANRRILTGAKGVQAAFFAFILLTLLFASRAVYASPQRGEAAYNRGDYGAAAQSYREAAKGAPDNAQLQFNLGGAAYKNKKYDEALNAFQKALNVQEISLQNKAYYNTGNTLYRMGEGISKIKPQETIQRWEASIKAYEGALKLDPDDADAKYNQEYVKKRLEELKKQQKQNQKNSCKNKNNQKDQKKNQNKDQNNQQSKGQNKNKDKQQSKNKNNKQDNQQANNQQKKKGQKGQDHSQEAKKDNQQKHKPQEKGKSKPDNNRQAKENRNSAQADSGDRKDQKGDRSDKAPTAGKSNRMKSKDKAHKSPVQRTGRQRKPGQMTEEQARNLLDSLKGEEKAVPMVAGDRGHGKGRQEKKRRDW
ncbi:MAG: VWA domain-containing protein [Deltaproteobacteria bacterium]|nr:VWA domain-containing protein [Deltaproteobacteria bacterium]